MKITFLIPQINFSGGNRVVAIYCQKLRKMGHEVVVISGTHRIPSIVEQIKSVLRGRGWKHHSPYPNNPYFSDLGVPVQVIETYRPFLESDVPDADVVIATWWETAESMYRFGPKKGAKVHFVQGHEVFPYLPIDRCKAVYRLPLKRIVISDLLKRIMAESYGDRNCVLIKNSVDMNQFFAAPRQKQTTPTIGFYYSKTSLKGLDVIIQCLKKLKDSIPSLKGVTFSSEQMSPDLQLPDWVDFNHRPPQDEIRNIYSQCDVWICASRTEGFHLPPLEAMACRCPVVSTKVGGPIDIIKDGVNGYLVEIDDGDGLFEKSLEVLRLPNDRWMKMSLAAESTAMNYTWDHAAALFESALIEAAAGISTRS